MAKKKTTTDPKATAEAPKAKASKEAKASKPAKQAKPAKEPKAKKMSALDAAAKVLGDAGQPMTCAELITAMAEKGLWKSPGGATPANTLYAAIAREIKVKAKDSRFKKADRGKFAKA